MSSGPKIDNCACTLINNMYHTISFSLWIVTNSPFLPMLQCSDNALKNGAGYKLTAAKNIYIVRGILTPYCRKLLVYDSHFCLPIFLLRLFLSATTGHLPCLRSLIRQTSRVAGTAKCLTKFYVLSLYYSCVSESR